MLNRKGDLKDRNLEQATLSRLDSIPNVEYIGKSDVRALDDNRFQAVIIYYVTDSTAIKLNTMHASPPTMTAREVYTWEELDSNVLGDTKQMISDKLEEKRHRHGREHD